MSKPAYRANTVIKRGDDKEDYWLNIGMAFENEDGRRINILVQAAPLDGKLVLRRSKDNPADEKPKKKR
jgi:hypothetical protein